MRNIDHIKEIENKRNEIYSILSNADDTIMTMLCKHCKKKSRCTHKEEHSIFNEDDKCVSGLEKWLFEEMEQGK